MTSSGERGHRLREPPIKDGDRGPKQLTEMGGLVPGLDTGGSRLCAG